MLHKFHVKKENDKHKFHSNEIGFSAFFCTVCLLGTQALNLMSKELYNSFQEVITIFRKRFIFLYARCCIILIPSYIELLVVLKKRFFP